MRVGIVDIGSNTARLLVADVSHDDALTPVGTRRAYLGLGAEIARTGLLGDETIERTAMLAGAYAARARVLGAEAVRTLVTAPGRQAATGAALVAALERGTAAPVRVLSADEEGRLAFAGVVHAIEGRQPGVVGVVDVGGGSTEVILGTVPGGASKVLSWRVGSGVLADELISSDPPSAAEIRKVRDRIDDIFDGVEIEHPAQAVAVGGSATSLRRLVGAVLEYETLERGIRVLCGDPAADVARRFELDPQRVRILTTGVLLLEKVSELLGQPLQIGKGGLREGVILDLLNGSANGHPVRIAA
jgi:exopolyphosphatase/guanosine-5'-triphosphate,3'-diphosphate pyrophosphatase